MMSVRLPRKDGAWKDQMRGCGSDTLLLAPGKRNVGIGFGILLNRFVRTRIFDSTIRFFELLDISSSRVGRRGFVALCIAKLPLDEGDHFDEAGTKKIRVVVNGTVAETVGLVT
jgi:hypothetical protein